MGWQLSPRERSKKIEHVHLASGFAFSSFRKVAHSRVVLLFHAPISFLCMLFVVVIIVMFFSK